MEQWQHNFDVLNALEHRKYFFYTSQKEKLTFGQVMELLSENLSFRNYFIDVLKDIPFEAYFWETPPVRKNDLDIPFEFVVLQSKHLSQIPPDRRSFSRYFNQKTDFEDVVSFMNLGKDALLIVPSPTENNDYPHLAAFMALAPKEQLLSFWQCTGKTMLEYVHEKPTWLSTAGLGVSWLHLRLDSRPKYYKHRPYKIALGQ